MKKQVITVSLSAIVALASFSTAFATTDTCKINNDGSVVINYAYDDAQREGGQVKTLKATKASSKSVKVKSYKETLTKENSTAITGYEYSGYGWTNLTSDGKEIYHSTTATLEYRTGSGQGETYASKKESGKGKVVAQTEYIQTPSTAYVYYNY